MNEVIAGYFAGNIQYFLTYKLVWFALNFWNKSLITTGLSGVVVGYPLDTVKALIQTRGKSITSIARGLNVRKMNFYSTLKESSWLWI